MSFSAEDHAAILDLSARYNHTFDSGNFDAWVTCFAEDGVYEVPELDRRIEGRGALRAFAAAQGFTVSIRTLPTTHVVDEAGEGATMLSFFSVLRLDDPPSSIVAGRYEDKLTKVDGEWQLARRKVVVYWSKQADGWV